MSVLRRILFGLCALLLAQAPTPALQGTAQPDATAVATAGAEHANHQLRLSDVVQFALAKETGEMSQAADDEAVPPPAIEPASETIAARPFDGRSRSTRLPARRPFDARGPPIRA